MCMFSMIGCTKKSQGSISRIDQEVSHFGLTQLFWAWRQCLMIIFQSGLLTGESVKILWKDNLGEKRRRSLFKTLTAAFHYAYHQTKPGLGPYLTTHTRTHAKVHVFVPVFVSSPFPWFHKLHPERENV